MNGRVSLLSVVEPVIDSIPSEEPKNTLRRAFASEPEAIHAIESCFARIATRRWSPEFLRTFVSSWKATHLKMLAIYGLSCRLQRLAASTQGTSTEKLFHLAAACNAETSYEDLGLDFGGETHADLYDRFAGNLVGDDAWLLKKYCVPEARDFSRWVYRNMVVEDIETGLLTNMFSEIYNHGEYSLALEAFGKYFASHTDLSDEDCRIATTYISAHVEDEVEADHFMVVVKALEAYRHAVGSQFDADRAEALFRQYLRALGAVMSELTARMESESKRSEVARYSVAVA